MDFLIWRSQRGDDFCVIDEPDIENSWELTDGIPRLANASAPIPCEMSSRYPKEVRLADNLHGASVPVISAAVKNLLSSHAKGNQIEYLPAQIINHKGRVASNDYFVLHSLDVVECIDIEASGVQWNRIDPGLISRCKGLVINESSIPPDFVLFRPKHWGDNILVRKDVASALEDAGLTGLYFRPTDGYTGIG